jgi:hypothetical protein
MSRRRAILSVTAVLAVVSVGVLVVHHAITSDWTRSESSIRAYVAAHEGTLTRQANAVLSNPKAKTAGSRVGDEWVDNDDGGSLYARWDEDEALFKGYGLVYDPHHVLEPLRDGSFASLYIYNCDPVRDRWFWCEVY